jgi:DNA-directed RNA polymerase specialized sigma24 family protein
LGLPWLLGVARNLLRQQFGQATRQQRLADHISALTTEADLLTWDAGEHADERADQANAHTPVAPAVGRIPQPSPSTRRER